jgi:hypothetical protein
VNGFTLTPQIGDITEDAFDRLDSAAGAPSCHGRIRQREADGRWRVQYLRGCDEAQLQAVVPLFTPRPKSWPDPAYDPRTWGLPGLTEDDGLPGGSMLVGGCADLRSTLHVRPEVRDSWKFTEVLGQIARLAADEGRSLVFPYVYEDTKNALTRASGDRAASRLLGREAVLSGVSDPGWEDRLGAHARYEWRRDRRLIAESGVISQIKAWADVEDTACELIAAHNVVKGRPDHPEFVRMRYRQWAQCAQVECLAFTASTRTLHGVTTALVWNGEIEVYELGITGLPGPDRRALYLDLVFRQPLGYAQRHGLQTIRLGMMAETPKSSRGADFRNIYGAVISVTDTNILARREMATLEIT